LIRAENSLRQQHLGTNTEEEEDTNKEEDEESEVRGESNE